MTQAAGSPRPAIPAPVRGAGRERSPGPLGAAPSTCQSCPVLGAKTLPTPRMPTPKAAGLTLWWGSAGLTLGWGSGRAGEDWAVGKFALLMYANQDSNGNRSQDPKSAHPFAE